MAYSFMRPDVGYVQGMAHIAGLFLLHCGPPQECFKAFSNITATELLYNFYSFDTEKITITYKVFWRLIREVCPRVYEELVQEELVSCSVFLLGWILTLFSSTFDIAISSLIWDQIFFLGDYQVLRVAVTICKIVEDNVQDAMQNDETFEMLREIRDCHKYVTDKEELLVNLKKTSKQIPLSYIKELYSQAEKTMDTEFLLRSSLEWQWS